MEIALGTKQNVAKTGGRVAMPQAEKNQRAARIKALRENFELTQQQVADRAGVPRELISKFESGVNAATTSETQGAIAKAFDLRRDLVAEYLAGKLTLKELLSPMVELTERYDKMSAVRHMALVEGFDPVFVRDWEAHLDADEQPSANELWNLMRADHARFRGKAISKGDALADLDAAPTRPRKKR